MEWYFSPGEYTVTGAGLKRARDGPGRTAVGRRTWSSDELHEFVFIVKNQTAGFCVGFVDATNEATLQAGSAAFGVGVTSWGAVSARTYTNAVALTDQRTDMTLRIASFRHGAISEIRASLQENRLHMSFDGEFALDIGYTLPARVAPFVIIFGDGDEIEVVEPLWNLPLQVFAHAHEGSITLACTTIGGEEVGSVDSLGPEDLGSALADLVREAIPAPLGGQWKLVLSDGTLLQNELLLLPLQELFECDKPSGDLDEQRAISEDVSMRAAAEFPAADSKPMAVSTPHAEASHSEAPHLEDGGGIQQNGGQASDRQCDHEPRRSEEFVCGEGTKLGVDPSEWPEDHDRRTFLRKFT